MAADQLAMFATEDARRVVLAVRHVYPCQRLCIHELLTCWNPGGARGGKPWPSNRVYAAIEAAVSCGALARYDGFDGTYLREPA